MEHYFGIFYCFLNFGTILIILHDSGPAFALANLWNRNTFSHQTSQTCGPLPLVVHLIFFETIWITILDLEPNLDFKIILNISKTNNGIFITNISNCRSGQVLPFIFFDLRALVNLWGRYGWKTSILTVFGI